MFNLSLVNDLRGMCKVQKYGVIVVFRKKVLHNKLLITLGPSVFKVTVQFETEGNGQNKVVIPYG